MVTQNFGQFFAFLLKSPKRMLVNRLNTIDKVSVQNQSTIKKKLKTSHKGNHRSWSSHPTTYQEVLDHCLCFACCGGPAKRPLRGPCEAITPHNNDARFVMF
jgi:hypothetical protein